MSQEAIAEAIGISVKTLVVHFSADMEIASAKVTAQNKMLEQVGAVKAQEKRAPKPEKMGKKQEQKLAAHSVGGRFATPSAPKLIVSND